MNWDALEEWLRDIAPTEHNGFLLVFRSARALLTLSGRDRNTFISILKEAAQFWSQGIRLSCVLIGSSALIGAISSLAS